MTSTTVSLPDSGPKPPPRLLGPQTAGSLVRAIVHTYRRHFGVLMACSLLPGLPFILLLVLLLVTEGGAEYAFVVMLPFMLAAFVASGAMTAAISDIVLGNRPTVVRAYTYVLQRRRWLYILGAGLVLTLLTWVGLLLLVLPGMWVMARGFLTAIVVTLEDRRPIDAIRRSFALTHRQAWRIIGLTSLVMALVYIVFMLVVFAVVFAAVLVFDDPQVLGPVLVTAFYGLSLALFGPMVGITMVLLYYDQRVRREAYDVQALAEDLMR